MKKLKYIILVFIGLVVALIAPSCAPKENVKELVDGVMQNFKLPFEDSNVPSEFEINKTIETVTLTATTINEDVSISEENDVIKVKVKDSSKNVDYVLNITFAKDDYQTNKEFNIKFIATVSDVSIANFYKAKDGDIVKVKGTVYSKAVEERPGYFIYDETGTMFVYENNKDVNIGDVVTVNGFKTYHFSLPQLKYETSKEKDLQIVSSDGKMPSYPKASILDITRLNVMDEATYGKTFKVEGKVLMKNEDYVTNFYLQDPKTFTEVKVDYTSNVDVLGLYVDKYVEINVNVYTYNDSTGYWSVYYSKTENLEDSIKEISEPTLSDNDKVNASLTNIYYTYNNMKVYDDIDFIKNGIYGTSLSYKSSNPSLISDDGKLLQVVDQNQDVKFTVTCVCNDVTLTREFTITVGAINLSSLSELANSSKLYSQDDVAVKGVVSGYYGVSGYYISEGENSIYVKGYDEHILVGDEVLVVGTFSNVNKGVRSEPQFLTVSRSKVLSSGNEVPQPKELTLDQLINVSSNSTLVGKHVTVTGYISSERSQYGNTYLLSQNLGDETSVSFQGNSNTYGIDTLVNQQVKITGYLKNLDKNSNFVFYFENSYGDVTSLSSTEEVLTSTVDYVTKLYPGANNEAGVNLLTNLNLIKNHPMLKDVSISYESSNQSVLTNDGKIIYPSTTTNVTLTCKISYNSTTREIPFNYVIGPKNDLGIQDLVFTMFARGAKNDKMFAIYNGTGKDIDLTGYRIGSIQNAGTGANSYTYTLENAQGILDLGEAYKEQQTAMGLTADGIMKNGQTIFVYHEAITRDYLDSIPDDVVKIPQPNNNGVCAFNGKDGDTLVLMNNNNCLVDLIGSFERVKKGEAAPYEQNFFELGYMTVRKHETLTNNPDLNWNNIEEVNKYYEVRKLPGVEEGYVLDKIVYDFKNGK